MCESRFLEKINGILQHADFQKYMRQNRQAEKDRVFCHHDWQHALDVARICYILCLEKGIFTQSKLDGKLLCYATALLHDIGRFAEAGGSTAVPLAVQVHHAVCDGRHVSLLVADVQRFCAELAARLA